MITPRDPVFQLFTSTLDGSHVEPKGVGDGSVVHFTIVVNQGHDHGCISLLL